MRRKHDELLLEINQSLSEAVEDLLRQVHYPFEEAVDPSWYEAYAINIASLLRCKFISDDADASCQPNRF